MFVVSRVDEGSCNRDCVLSIYVLYAHVIPFVESYSHTFTYVPYYKIIRVIQLLTDVLRNLTGEFSLKNGGLSVGTGDFRADCVQILQ